ncbi:MAG: tail fiber domain-containing protein [Bacteroidota bacterium]
MRIGIGTSDTDNSKLKVMNADNSFSLKLENNFTGINKCGIENKISGEGNGSLFGLMNEVFQDANASYHTSGVRGIFNNVNVSSSNNVIGTVNSISNSGTGYKIGTHNSIAGFDSETIIGSNNIISPSTTGSSTVYGMYANVKNFGTGTKYGVFATINGGSGFAGRFLGNVKITGDLDVTGTINGNPSDAKLKENIETLENALELITDLAPKTFNFLTNNDLSLPQGNQYGLIAQEVEVVLPDLVKEVSHEVETATFDIENPDESIGIVEATEIQTYKTVNYNALIPILIGAIKEQQQQIEQMQAIIADLQDQ